MKLVFSSTTILAILILGAQAKGNAVSSSILSSGSISQPSVSLELCTSAVRQSHISQVKQALRISINSQPGLNLIAAFVRAAFHDCITATTDKADSGCNGSLRLPTELAHPNNGRLATAMTIIQASVVGTCVSVADAIQLATAVALLEAGGPDIADDIVSAESPRTDALIADTVDNELPNRNDTYQQSLSFYVRKGLSATDLISSYAGGHSLGGFSSGSGIQPFTTDVNSVSSSYSKNLVRRAEGAPDNLPGFNTLSSDANLIQNELAVQSLRHYSGCAQLTSGCEQDDTVGLTNLNEDFKNFLIRCSKLTGTTVGDASKLNP